MIAILYNLAALHNQDAIGAAHGAQSVRNHQAGARAQDAIQRFLNVGFGGGIDAAVAAVAGGL